MSRLFCKIKWIGQSLRRQILKMMNYTRIGLLSKKRLNVFTTILKFAETNLSKTLSINRRNFRRQALEDNFQLKPNRIVRIITGWDI